MERYVIVGNGVAGIEAAFEIRSRRPPEQATIHVISDETDYFFSRTALMYAYMDVMEREDLEPFERATYRRQNIELVRGRVVDLDSDAMHVELESGEKLGFDKLLLAVGAKPRMFPWKGMDAIEDGIVQFVSMQDLDACERLTWSTEQAVVIGGGLIGIELIECFLHHGLSTTFLIREPYYWPIALGQLEGDMVTETLRAHGVDVRLEEEMTEAIGDSQGRIKEVLTNKGNRLPCQMLGIAVGVKSNCDWLDDTTTPPAIGHGIQVDHSFHTSLPDVWAAGDCCEIDLGDDRPLIELIWYSAKLHGRLAARSMLGDHIAYDPPIFYNSSKFLDIEYTTVGQVVNLPSDRTNSLYRRHSKKRISQRIVWNDDDEVIGFNMLGSRWNHTVLERWIQQRRDWRWVRDHLGDAQFDVEFGRVNLEQFEEQEVPV